MNIVDGRKQIKENAVTQALYMKTIDDADAKFKEDFVEIPYETSIKIGMIEHYIKKHPDTDKSDEEILEYIEYLFDKHEDDDVFAKTRANGV